MTLKEIGRKITQAFRLAKAADEKVASSIATSLDTIAERAREYEKRFEPEYYVRCQDKKVIEKKIWPKYFEKVQAREKTFELRKDEDDVQTGDILVLNEYREGNYTGRSVSREVTYVLRDAENLGLMKGYCIIAIQPVDWS